MGTCKYFVFCKVSVLINNTVAYLYLNENLILCPDQEGHIWIFLSRCKQRGCLYTFTANGIEDSEIHPRKYIREVVQWGEICCAKLQSCAWKKKAVFLVKQELIYKHASSTAGSGISRDYLPLVLQGRANPFVSRDEKFPWGLSRICPDSWHLRWTSPREFSWGCREGIFSGYLFSSKGWHGTGGRADCSGQTGSPTGRKGSSLHRFQCSSDGLVLKNTWNTIWCGILGSLSARLSFAKYLAEPLRSHLKSRFPPWIFRPFGWLHRHRWK